MLRGHRFLIAATCGLTVLLSLATGAYFGALYTPDHKQYQAVAGNQPGQNDYRGPSQSLPDISGLPGPVERAIANPKPSTGQDHEKRDLAAQEASALWAFWMVVASFLSVLITTLGTIFLYKQIVLTREAVEDTGKATMAMERQNELVHQAQRPWINIQAKLTDIYVGQNNVLHIQYETIFKNIGQTVATNVYYQTSVLNIIEPIIPDIRHNFANFERDWQIHLRETAIMPGEEGGSFGEASYAVNYMKWCEKEGFRKDCFVFLACKCRYKIPGDDEWHFTMRTFAIGEVITHMDCLNLVFDSVTGLNKGNTTIRQFGLSRAT